LAALQERTLSLTQKQTCSAARIPIVVNNAAITSPTAVPARVGGESGHPVILINPLIAFKIIVVSTYTTITPKKEVPER